MIQPELLDQCDLGKEGTLRKDSKGSIFLVLNHGAAMAKEIKKQSELHVFLLPLKRSSDGIHLLQDCARLTRTENGVVTLVLTVLGDKDIPLFDVLQGLILDGTPSAACLSRVSYLGASNFGTPSTTEHGWHLTMCSQPSSVSTPSAHGSLACHSNWNFLVRS
jgi:hypothetical protein